MNQAQKKDSTDPESNDWRERLHEIIFEADTPAGKNFDLVLIVCISLSILAVMLDTVESVRQQYRFALLVAEWFFTIVFTVEYILRLLTVRRAWGYAASFYGVVDLLAIIPTYLSLFLPGSQYFLVVRALRFLRIFRVLKLGRFLSEADQLRQALQASRRKILVFLLTVMTIVVIAGSVMYLVEGGHNGFTSIPKSAYWAIVTLTTVGYGDISPQTTLGQMIASMIMILGYAIIAVPTGIVTAEIAYSSRSKMVSTQSCPVCCAEGHDADAKFCKYCGAGL